MRILHTMLRVGDLERVDRLLHARPRHAAPAHDRPARAEVHAGVRRLRRRSARRGARAHVQLRRRRATTSAPAFGHVAIEVRRCGGGLRRGARRAPSGGTVTREAGPVKGGTTVIAFVQDPDGYKIELIEAKRRRGSMPAGRRRRRARRRDRSRLRGAQQLAEVVREHVRRPGRGRRRGAAGPAGRT